jgi:hypothetical protein
MSRINKRAKRVLLGIDVYEKAKTSAALMFLKGFGYDQCEEDVAKQPSHFTKIPLLSFIFNAN